MALMGRALGVIPNGVGLTSPRGCPVWQVPPQSGAAPITALRNINVDSGE